MKTKYLSDSFKNKYKGVDPFKTKIGKFTYLRTYSRYLPEEGRRETWLETVTRVVEYSMSLSPNSTIQEAEELFDNIFYLRQFLSGRTMFSGGTEISEMYPMSNFNCSFAIVDSVETFDEVLYLLLIGAGVGFRVLDRDVAKLPKFRQDLVIEHKYYEAKPKMFRNEYTGMSVTLDEIEIEIGDSKEGWKQAIELLIKLYTDKTYRNINKVIIQYNNVRPKGEILKRFGGYASGHEGLHDMFKKIGDVVKANKNDGAMTPMEMIDILNIEGEGVVSGGVRRTAEIALIGQNDNDSIQMKNELYKQVDGEWILDESIAHRQVSNNSIYYESKPTREFLHWQIEQMRYSGEPAWVNAEYGKKRRDNFNGVNPCGEILLDNKGVCNLTEVNAMAFVREVVVETGTFEEPNAWVTSYEVDHNGLMNAQRLSARAGVRMTLPELELKSWDVINKRDNLIGCSLTGWQDMVNITGMSKEGQIELLSDLKSIVDYEAQTYAKELGINEPKLKTTIKPSGTLSLLPTVSSGIHRSHSPYYIRRIRINAHDPLAKAMMEMGYPWNPEVGQKVESMSTIVVEFPVKAPDGQTKGDVGAIEQLEDYLMFMEHYVDHNVSITVHVRDDEWEEVEEFVWEHWDEIMAVSFLPYNDSFYELLPYEEISKEEYEKLVATLPEFDIEVLNKLETGQVFDLEADCDSGVCQAR